MSRRIITLVLLPCVVILQSIIAIGHTHGTDQSTGHNLRPHVHLTSSSDAHGHSHHHHEGHGHHHGAHGHHHSHNDSDHRDSHEEGESVPPVPLSHNEHDSGAVFFDGIDVILSQRTSFDEELSSSFFAAAAALSHAPVSCIDASELALDQEQSPPVCVRCCALYVLQSSLLI